MVPEGFTECPAVPIGMQFYWEAFWDLHTCRSVGFGPGPIPWIAIDAYATRYGIEGDEFDTFKSIIRCLDAVVLDHDSDLEDEVVQEDAGHTQKLKALIRSVAGQDGAIDNEVSDD